MRFFKRLLRPGMPWSTPGIIEGLADIATAVETLECQGGAVRFHGKRLVIYPGTTGAGAVIPVQLVVTSATSALNGDHETQCGFRYDVFAIDADTEVDDALLLDVSPIAGGHRHKRPTVGYMIVATFGYAHYESGALKLGFINEIVDAEACPEEPEP